MKKTFTLLLGLIAFGIFSQVVLAQPYPLPEEEVKEILDIVRPTVDIFASTIERRTPYSPYNETIFREGNLTAFVAPVLGHVGGTFRVGTRSDELGRGLSVRAGVLAVFPWSRRSGGTRVFFMGFTLPTVSVTGAKSEVSSPQASRFSPNPERENIESLSGWAIGVGPMVTNNSDRINGVALGLGVAVGDTRAYLYNFPIPDIPRRGVTELAYCYSKMRDLRQALQAGDAQKARSLAEQIAKVGAKLPELGWSVGFEDKPEHRWAREQLDREVREFHPLGSVANVFNLEMPYRQIDFPVVSRLVSRFCPGLVKRANYAQLAAKN